jgi:hypothetical protein
VTDLSVNLILQNNNCAFFEEQRDYEASMLKRYNIIILCVAVTVACSLIGLIVAIALK